MGDPAHGVLLGGTSKILDVRRCRRQSLRNIILLGGLLILIAVNATSQNMPGQPSVDTVQVKADGSSVLRLKGIDIEFDKTGQWSRIYSTYIQPVDFPDRRGIEKAQLIAEEKGKAEIIRFFNQQVESDRLVEEVNSEVQHASISQSTGSKDQLSRTTQRTIVDSVKEFTHSYASGNLRGVTVLETGYDQKAEAAWVKVGLSRKTIATAQDLQQSMRTGNPSTPGNADSGKSQGVPSQPSEVRSGRDLPQ